MPMGFWFFRGALREHLSREFKITQEATQAFFQGKFTECLVGKANLAEVLPLVS